MYVAVRSYLVKIGETVGILTQTLIKHTQIISSSRLTELHQIHHVKSTVFTPKKIGANLDPNQIKELSHEPLS